MNKALREILEIGRLGLILIPRESGKVNNKPYKFNTLSDVQELLAPVLKEHGLYVMQNIESTVDALIITTEIFHEEEMEDTELGYIVNYAVPHTSINTLTLTQADASMGANARKTVLKSLFGIISKETIESNDGAGEEIKAKKKVLVKGSEEETKVKGDLSTGKTTIAKVKEKYIINDSRLTELELGL